MTDAVIVELTVIPTEPLSLPVGAQQQYTAEARYSDNRSIEVTDLVNWVVEPNRLGSFDAEDKGLFTADEAGAGLIVSSIRASADPDAPLVIDSTPITVTDAVATSVQIVPHTEPGDPVEIPAGLVEQWTGLGNFTDGVTRDITDDSSWTSSNTTVATVRDGEIVTIAPGTTTIRMEYAATSAGLKDSLSVLFDELELTVTAAPLQSIEITPASATT